MRPTHNDDLTADPHLLLDLELLMNAFEVASASGRMTELVLLCHSHLLPERLLVESLPIHLLKLLFRQRLRA